MKAEETAVIEASRRNGGRGAARALRRAGRVPAVLYGAGGKAGVCVSCCARALDKLLQGASFFPSMLTVALEGRRCKALLREAQYHPVRPQLLHVDLQQVSEQQEISAVVPLRFVGAERAPGVRLRRGIFNAIENRAAVHCRAADLPEYITVDVSAMEIGGTIHLSGIAPPAGVRFDEIARGNDPALAVIAEARVEEEEPAAAPAAGAAAAEDGGGQ